MGMSRSPVAICENGKSGQAIHAPLAIAGPFDDSRTTSCSGCRAPVSCQDQDRHSARRIRQPARSDVAWLDANCGADGWTSTPSSTRGVVNDALAICFADATLASAFVARWCAMQRVEIVDGVYQVRNDEPTPRIGAALHRTL